MTSSVRSSLISSPRATGMSAPVRLGRSAIIGILRIYKGWISPMLPSACRFRPTCSEYMMEAVERHGVMRGVWMGLKRLARCQPLCQGGFDPVR